MALADLIAAKSSAESRLASVTAELAGITPTAAGGLPDSPAGIQHRAYKDGLLAEIKTLQESIANLKTLIAENDTDGSDWQIVSLME